MADEPTNAGRLAVLEVENANLKKDNKKYRDRLRDIRAGQPAAEVLQKANDDLTTELEGIRGKVLPEGQVAVLKADADLLPAYKALGADPKKIADDLKKKGELETEVAETKRTLAFEAAAKSVGFKPSVLTKLARSEKFDVEERDVTEEVDGEKKTKKVPYARMSGDDKAEWLPLDKFAEKNLADFLPSLKDDGENGRAVTGREFPRQTSSEQSKAPANDVVAGYMGRTYVRPSERNKQSEKKTD